MHVQRVRDGDAEERADDADDDVGQDPHLAVGLHQDARQPADDASDDQRD
jgi:hypothetical protein